MIGPALRAELRRLVLRDGWKIETVARRFGLHHSTVRRAIQDEAPEQSSPPVFASALDPFKPFIVERLTQAPQLTAVRLLAELRQQGFTHSIAILRRYIVQVRSPRSRKAFLRVETEPGDVAQVDWGLFGRMRVGNTYRPLSAFVMALHWSRALFLDFSLDMHMDTFLRMHQCALAFFGGVPKRIVYDNLKSVVIHHVGSTVQFNPTFLGFAGHYLFEPVAAPVRYPQGKGTVEAAIKYVRHSFFYGRTFSGIEQIRTQARLWCEQTANARIHSATRQRPWDQLLIERTRFRPLPQHPYDTDLVVPCIVSKEARVQLDTNTYSVPPSLVGRSVLVRADEHFVRIVADGAVVAEHKRCWERRRVVQDPAHIQAVLAQRSGAQGPKRRDRIASLSPHSRAYLQEVARRRIDLESEVRKLLRLIDLYGEQDIADAMAAALSARTIGARYVQALADQARFARGLPEPAEPIITGNPEADSTTVEPHNLESYDDLF